MNSVKINDGLTAEQFTDELRLPCVWPGMYQKHFIMADGEAMCFECATKEKEHILIEIRDQCEPDWRPVSMQVNWEDNHLSCCHCNERIKSEYGE